jgi:hypothetical protein
LNNIKGSNSVYATYSPFTFSFNVVSNHGTTSPTGTTTNNYGTTLDCNVLDSPVTLGAGSRAVANGGTVTGNAYTQNNATNITINSPGLTNNATLTRNWDTQKLLTASSSNGTTSVSSNWYNLGQNASVSNMPNQFYSFVRWNGDVPAGSESNNPVTLPMNQARNIWAENAETLTTNGTSLKWLNDYGLNQSDDDIDRDADGLLTWQEYIAGTDPTNPASYFGIADLTKANPLELNISISSTGRTYYIDASSNLAEGEAGWAYTGTNSPGTGSNLTLHVDAGSDNKGFYRARVEKTVE